ncbi:RraA family protein [Devosia sp. 2618]|uniref:RraA family protein n=1 Tax=Devosia sp. 2618 TaxID=3156454 RepID=UPI003397D015
MYEINKPAPQLDPALIERMLQVETATLGHVLHSGFVDPAVAPLLPGARIAGTAFTVRIPGADSATLHYALTMVRPGDVLVIDRSGDDSHACWGGVVTNAAKLCGVAGAIIDGRATDLNEIRANAMPVWARGVSSKTTKFLGLGGAINVPVSIGGQTVLPGDGIFADESGVVVISPDRLEGLVDQALAMQDNELRVLARLRAGERLADISGATKMVEQS